MVIKKDRIMRYAVLLMLAVMLGFAGVAAADTTVSMQIDGQNVIFSDQPPYLDDATGRVMIPLRAVTESMGAVVTWDAATRTAKIERNGTIILMQLNSKQPVVNGVVKQIDAPATVSNGRTVVPLRFLSEAFGADIRWDGNRKNTSVYLNTKAPAESSTPEATQRGIKWARWELAEVAKVIDVEWNNAAEDYITDKAYTLIVVYDKEKEIFAVNMILLDRQETQKDVKNMLKVFFPTGYQKVYNDVMEAWRITHATKGNSNKVWDYRMDGRRLVITMDLDAIYLEIK